MAVVFIDARVIPALVENPFLFTWCQLPLKLSFVLANHAFERVIVAIAQVISSLWNSPRFLNVVFVRDEGFSVWTKTLENLSVKASVFVGRVAPIFLLEGEIVIEKVVTFNELASVPFSNVTPLIKIDKLESCV